MVRLQEVRVAKIKVLSAPTAQLGLGLRRDEACVPECAQRIEDQLYLAACSLTTEAQQAADPNLRRFLTQAARRVIAAGRTEARLRTLNLADEAAVIAALPEICTELWACLDDEAPSVAEEGLAALAAAAINGRASLVDAARAVADDVGDVCVRLEHGGRSVNRLMLVDGVVMVEADAGPAREGLVKRLRRALARHLEADTAPVRGTSISLLLG